MQGGHYHGCWSDRKKHGTRRVIDYERGYDCIASTDKQCWTSTKMKYLKRRPYYTRQRVAIHDKVRKELVHEVKKAIYDTLIRTQARFLHNCCFQNIIRQRCLNAIMCMYVQL